DEVSGSRRELLAIGAAPVTTFACPYGQFNSTVIRAIHGAGFVTAVNSNPGTNVTNDNPLMLRRFSITSATTLDQVKTAIDEAASQRTYLILLFHRVDRSATDYSIPPEEFEHIVAYLKASDVSVVTHSAALRMMQP